MIEVKKTDGKYVVLKGADGTVLLIVERQGRGANGIQACGKVKTGRQSVKISLGRRRSSSLKHALWDS